MTFTYTFHLTLLNMKICLYILVTLPCIRKNIDKSMCFHGVSLQYVLAAHKQKADLLF